MPPSSTSSTGPPDPPVSVSASSNANTKNPTTGKTDKSQDQYALSANFAHDPKAPAAPYTISYDQETYLQLVSGESGDHQSFQTTASLTGVSAAGAGTAGSGTGLKKNKNKTPTQIYREEWVRRALNPAISDPRGDPSPIDFECAETQRVRERF